MRRPKDIFGETYLIPTIRIERNDTPEDLRRSLHEKFAMFSLKLTKSPIIVDLTDVSGDGSPHAKIINRTEFNEYLVVLKEFGMLPVGVSNPSARTLKIALQRGLPRILHTRWSDTDSNLFEQEVNCMKTETNNATDEGHDEVGISTHRNEEQEQAKPKPLATEPMIVDSSVRTGQQIYAKGSSLVVLGSVNSGAEVLADGDIHVYGALKGRALAGIGGNTWAKVFAHKFDAELVSIADTFTTGEFIQEFPELVIKKPTYIWLNNGQLHFKSICIENAANEIATNVQ